MSQVLDSCVVLKLKNFKNTLLKVMECIHSTKKSIQGRGFSCSTVLFGRDKVKSNVSALLALNGAEK